MVKMIVAFASALLVMQSSLVMSQVQTVQTSSYALPQATQLAVPQQQVYQQVYQPTAFVQPQPQVVTVQQPQIIAQPAQQVIAVPQPSFQYPVNQVEYVQQPLLTQPAQPIYEAQQVFTQEYFGQPQQVVSQPLYINQQPQFVNQQPQFVNQQPLLINQQPQIVNQQPLLINQQPELVYQQPQLVNQPQSSQLVVVPTQQQPCANQPTIAEQIYPTLNNGRSINGPIRLRGRNNNANLNYGPLDQNDLTNF